MFLLAQLSVWEMIADAKPLPMAVMVLLALLSVLSWALAWSKWTSLRASRAANLSFFRAFRKAESLQSMALAAEQFQASPAAGVFAFGYDEVARQSKGRGYVTHLVPVERALQLGVSAETSRLERNLSWLATIAAIAPFVGLLGTVWGIIDAFNSLNTAGTASLRAVGPGIADALVATGLGLFAAIPAAVFYNYFSALNREMATRLDDFCLEFLNLAERNVPQ